jgi:predicted transcriptional regulator
MMLAMADLRKKRKANDIPGRTVSKRAMVSTPRLCELELGNATATPDEIERISAAIETIITERQRISELVASEGLSLTAVGL